MRKFWTLFVVLCLALGLLGTAASAGKTTGGTGPSSPQTFLVALKAESISDSALQAIANAGGTVVERLDEIGTVAVTTVETTRFLKAMLGNSEIQSVTPSFPAKLSLPQVDVESIPGTSPADPANPAAYTWGVQRVTNDGAAWNVHPGTHDVVVAILDTGVDLTHPDLLPNLVPGSKSFVPSEPTAQDGHGHGTHVAGTIAANGGIKGVAPGVGIRAYKVLSARGSGSEAGILRAMIAAADDGSDVINMSLGGWATHGTYWYTDPTTGERFNLGNLDTATMVAWSRAVRYAVNKGVTVVVAAGNDGLDLAKRSAVTDAWNDLLHELGYTEFEVQGATFIVPAGLPGVVTVSAQGGGWNTPDRLAFYSNYGLVDLAAPGGDLGPDPNHREADYYKYLVLSTVPTNTNCVLARRLFGTCNYGWAAGTSMASPHAAGVAALIISEQYARTGTKPTPAQVVARMQQSAEAIGKTGHDPFYGAGLVNAYRALTQR